MIRMPRKGRSIIGCSSTWTRTFTTSAKAARRSWPRKAAMTGARLIMAGPSTPFGAAAAAVRVSPPQSTVVLLVGLPGDVESESIYRDQLQTWLEILSANGDAQNVFVLCDAAESVTIPASSATNRPVPPAILHADRT